mmetsp:Transcript_30487/g.29874  ORF Transcript_30487/g.29874 Transcript_30487/m.29874 type:complete len:112 (-) Transcript_30487:1863-2198(-)
MVNISRIELIWKILIAHFDILTNCKIAMLRQLSIEALLAIILEIFSNRKQHRPTNSEILENQRRGLKFAKVSSNIDEAPFTQDDEEDFDIDVDENWSGSIWQYTILTPFCD